MILVRVSQLPKQGPHRPAGMYPEAFRKKTCSHNQQFNCGEIVETATVIDNRLGTTREPPNELAESSSWKDQD